MTVIKSETITADGQPVATVSVDAAGATREAEQRGIHAGYRARLDTPGGDAWTIPSSCPTAESATGALRLAIQRSIRECEQALHAVEAFERGETEL